jgi:hypothetical protein
MTHFINNKYTLGIVVIVLFIIGFIEYKVYREFNQFVSIYKSNFSMVAKAAAHKIATNGEYCILASNFKDKYPWLMLNDFTEVNIDRVIKQAIYFRLGLPNRVKTGVGQRVPHFEMYANGEHYLWSFSQQSFYKYRIQNTAFDKYLSLICDDVSNKNLDRQAATIKYQNDQQWVQKFLNLHGQ